jgi:hypothetical protein
MTSKRVVWDGELSEIARLREENERLREGLQELLTYLPDAPRYAYAWDECLSDEQDAVKDVRLRAEALIKECGNDSNKSENQV